MADRPLVRVALTGGIATGKSNCLRQFSKLGADVIDADVLAREVVGPGTSGRAAVIARFGNAVLDSSGELDRAALGRVVFADPAARRDLEAIVHPDVYTAIASWFDRLDQGDPADATSRRVAIADIPLLFETNRAADFDRVIVVACSPGEQRARLIARGGLTELDARQRIAAQMPIAEKRQRADFVIDTDGSLEETDQQVAGVWEELRQLRS